MRRPGPPGPAVPGRPAAAPMRCDQNWNRNEAM